MVGDETLEVVSDFCYFGDMLSAAGRCELASIARCKCVCGKFRQLIFIVQKSHLINLCQTCHVACC